MIYKVQTLTWVSFAQCENVEMLSGQYIGDKGLPHRCGGCTYLVLSQDTYNIYVHLNCEFMHLKWHSPACMKIKCIHLFTCPVIPCDYYQVYSSWVTNQGRVQEGLTLAIGSLKCMCFYATVRLRFSY